tara:strand:- start:1438 stop:2100 length:663 start_codon:yes stop_codon:yes gene_type:complete
MKNKNIPFKIAIDGSSASGKTTGSKFISKKFKLKLLTSGKLYRFLALKILKNNSKYNPQFINKVSKKITLNNLNSKKIFTQKVTELASSIAKIKYIRNSLKNFQLNFIKKNKRIIIEGRDIASKIMPKADLKIFFKCSLKEKAKRRLNEYRNINKNIKLKDVQKALKSRDFLDKNRKESPLLFVKGAVLIDTTNLSKKKMEAKLFKLVNRRIINKINGNI